MNNENTIITLKKIIEQEEQSISMMEIAIRNAKNNLEYHKNILQNLEHPKSASNSS